MQHKVMIKAVESHMPAVIIIDEISTRAEVNVCQSMAEIKTMKNQARDSNIRSFPVSVF